MNYEFYEKLHSRNFTAESLINSSASLSTSFRASPQISICPRFQYSRDSYRNKWGQAKISQKVVNRMRINSTPYSSSQAEISQNKCLLNLFCEKNPYKTNLDNSSFFQPDKHWTQDNNDAKFITKELYQDERQILKQYKQLRRTEKNNNFFDDTDHQHDHFQKIATFGSEGFSVKKIKSEEPALLLKEEKIAPLRKQSKKKSINKNYPQEIRFRKMIFQAVSI